MQFVMLLLGMLSMPGRFGVAGLVEGVQAPQTPPPKLTLAFTINVQVGPPTELGEVPRGRRRIIPILGGTFEGPNIRGKVVPGGADWQIVRADGFAELDTRYTLQTDTGQSIYIQNAGIRHAPPEITRKLLAGEPVDPAQVVLQDHSDIRDIGVRAAVADPVNLHWDGGTSPGRSCDPSLEGGVTAERLKAQGSGLRAQARSSIKCSKGLPEP